MVAAGVPTVVIGLSLFLVIRHTAKELSRPWAPAQLPPRKLMRLHPPRGVARLAVFLFLALVGVVEPAWSQEANAGTLLPLPDRVYEFVRTYQALFGGALGAALGYLAKTLFDQWSAGRTARREFAQTVTSQISDLAKEYYWSLANYAGVLAGLLESYLDNRSHHLILHWPDRQALNRRLEEIANTFADMSFYHFCRLIGLFDTFQFQGSNTYLLTSHAAGETCKRLYNTFIASLPTDDAKDSIDTLKIVRVLREKRETTFSSEPLPVSEFPSALFMDEIAKGPLKEERKNYSSWIMNRILEVEEAADALRAYNELLNHELARLYRDFFRKTPPDAKLYLAEVAFDDWPNLLTEQSYSAIERSSIESALLRPLGAPISARQPSAGERRSEKRDDGGEHQPQRLDRDATEETITEIERTGLRAERGKRTEDREAMESDAKLGRLLRHMFERAAISDSDTTSPRDAPISDEDRPDG